jgi:hypothetical protein
MLAEQKRIMSQVEAMLARVNAARERLARVPAILKGFHQSVLAAASWSPATPIKTRWFDSRPLILHDKAPQLFAGWRVLLNKDSWETNSGRTQ